jgi:hypothetical protein
MLNYSIIMLLILYIAGCSRSCIDCEVHIRQTITELKDNRNLIVYDQDCTSNSPTITNISFWTKELNIKRDGGTIFRAKGIDSIDVNIISKDSVEIIYKQEDGFLDHIEIITKEGNLHGVTFIYEDRSNARFPLPSAN